MRDLPPGNLPEVAFCGRSNAGKSSAINRLCERRRLAFPSKTPGRTQALNYFAVGPEDDPCGYLVDTPGYGYAAVAKDIKKTWQALAGSYLRNGPNLVGVVVMIDCRRGLTDKDHELLDWFPPELPCLILVTKADKLSRMQQGKALDKLQRQYEEHQGDRAASFVMFSAQTGLGVDAARSLVEFWIAPSDGSD